MRVCVCVFGRRRLFQFLLSPSLPPSSGLLLTRQRQRRTDDDDDDDDDAVRFLLLRFLLDEFKISIYYSADAQQTSSGSSKWKRRGEGKIRFSFLVFFRSADCSRSIRLLTVTVSRRRLVVVVFFFRSHKLYITTKRNKEAKKEGRKGTHVRQSPDDDDDHFVCTSSRTSSLGLLYDDEKRPTGAVSLRNSLIPSLLFAAFHSFLKRQQVLSSVSSPPPPLPLLRAFCMQALT